MLIKTRFFFASRQSISAARKFQIILTWTVGNTDNDALACGKKPGIHKDMLKTPLDYDLLAEHLQPLYRRLSDPQLLQRCLLSATQNANESLHGSIWRLMSKNVFHNLSRATFLMTHAIANFNFGTAAAAELKLKLQIPESIHSSHLGLQRLKKRIDLSVQRADQKVQKRLAIKRAAKARRALETDGSYGPGICDIAS